MFGIGEFSKITGLTVKTLRFYHEEGLLMPASVDPQTGYRYYAEPQIEIARMITFLRGLEFPLNEIKSLLGDRAGDELLLEAMERQKSMLRERVAQYRKVLRQIDDYISKERQAAEMTQSEFDVQEKTIDGVTVAGVRMHGHYRDCGKVFGKIARHFGRLLAGPPLMLHYDAEYKDGDADFEACMPIRSPKAVDGIAVRDLAATRCVSLMHKGPYDQLGRSYAKVLKHVRDHGYKAVLPTRELYLKGPGIIFKGNPRNYLTEIQIPVQ